MTTASAPASEESRAIVPIRRPRSVVPTALDREFLPAALEILDTPPPPAGVAFLWMICALFVAAFAWSYFGWLDVYATAEGKVQPSGRSKIVQPFDAGKVTRLLVSNGQLVKTDEILIELDPTESFADRTASERYFDSLRAEIARRRAAIATAKSGRLIPERVVFDPATDPSVAARQLAVMIADVEQLAAQCASLDAQIEEKRATYRRLTMSIAARTRLLAALQERVDMRATLVDKDAGTRSSLIDARETMEREETYQATDRGSLLEATAGIETLGKQRAQTILQFISDQAAKLADADIKRDQTIQDLVKASAKNVRMSLTAPIDGIVQDLSVTTMGQVVTPGQSLMTIVPSDTHLEVEALVLNEDIGFVHEGQPAVLKIQSFPYTRYGTIEGTVVRISRDAIDARNSAPNNDIRTATQPQTATATTATQGAPSPQSLVFPVTIHPSKTTVEVDGNPIPLSPGMAVTAEIKTEQRRAIDYILSPLMKVAKEAGHER